ARTILSRATRVRFRRVEDLAAVWCEFGELELRHHRHEEALRVLRKATALPAKRAEYFDSSEPVQNRLYKSLRVWSMLADLEESLGTFQVGQDHPVTPPCPPHVPPQARTILSRATRVRFRRVEDLAAVWCEFGELELRHHRHEEALRVLRKATALPAKRAEYFDSSEPVQNRLYKSLRVWSMLADLEESLGTFQVGTHPTG
ncbi:uncharacterized protein LOC113942428, partial [Corapipo altera]|uniref:uncharacterized protein LOC113942428 n=1 Tax=Corapipo altera TaxID=415028 RepID=UPI000FD6742E